MWEPLTPNSQGQVYCHHTKGCVNEWMLEVWILNWYLAPQVHGRCCVEASGQVFMVDCLADWLIVHIFCFIPKKDLKCTKTMHSLLQGQKE